MNFLFLGDIVGFAGCNKLKKDLPNIISNYNLDFVVANGENSFDSGVGITQNITFELLSSGIDVITTGNHVWDQKETYDFIKNEKRLLRPLNLYGDLPGKGFNIFNSKKGFNVGVLNLMGNVFMKKCENVFDVSKKFLENKKLKLDYDFLIVDFHAEITSEKMAIGHFFDGEATLVVGTHTHVPTNDCRILSNGTAYQTDAGMCGDYDSIIGMNKEISLNRFFKKTTDKNTPSNGEASLCGVIVNANESTGLAKMAQSFIYSGKLER